MPYGTIKEYDICSLLVIFVNIWQRDPKIDFSHRIKLWEIDLILLRVPWEPFLFISTSPFLDIFRWHSRICSKARVSHCYCAQFHIGEVWKIITWEQSLFKQTLSQKSVVQLESILDLRFLTALRLKSVTRFWHQLKRC